MKYVIKDKQLFDVIYKFIDDMLTEDNITYQYGHNYDTDEVDKNILCFFGDKYSNNEQDDYYFEYVKKEYYENLGKNKWENSIKEMWWEKAPLIEIMDRDFEDKLNAFFSHFWKPVFEQWFRDKYPDLPVKTFTIND